MDTLTSNFHQLEAFMKGWWVTFDRWKLLREAGTKIGNLRANEGTQNLYTLISLRLFVMEVLGVGGRERPVKQRVCQSVTALSLSQVVARWDVIRGTE
jgi:hypothetical protein